MGYSDAQRAHPALWKLVRRQHGVVSRTQLRELGFSARSIQHRLATGRLHLVWRAVYAVGRPNLTRFGRWMAATLTCGADAVLSHDSAAALWEIRSARERPIEVSVFKDVRPRRPGIAVHRRTAVVQEETVEYQGIPVTSPICTLIDLAARLPRSEIEATINEADNRDLVSPDRLRAALDELTPRPGLKPLRTILDRRTFVLTDSELERHFLPLARRAGLPCPETRRYVNGFRVDFFWPDLGLVVETDSLRYHRTPAAQARDRLRDQRHAAAGLTPIRFTQGQIRYEPHHVCAILRKVAQRLQAPHELRVEAGGS